MDFDSGIVNVNDMIIASQNNAKNDKDYLEWIDFSHLRVEKRLDGGVFGVVYKATYYSIRRTTVAIKFFRDRRDFLKEFTNVYRMIKNCSDEDHYLRNKNIVHYYGATYDANDDEYGIVMKYYPQSSLCNYLYDNWINIYWDERLRILRDISYGLYTLHFNDLIHGDLHSGNVMINSSSSDLASIGDLGFCISEESAARKNEINGIMPFIAPEVFEDYPSSKKSDIYSFGMIMYQVATNRTPFYYQAHDNRLMKQIRNGKRPEIYQDDDMPLCFVNLMRHCWNSDPRSRPNALTLFDKFEYWINENGFEFEGMMWNRIDEPVDRSQFHRRAIYTSRTWY